MHIVQRLRMLFPFKYDGHIYTITGKPIMAANRNGNETPLAPHERDDLSKLVAGCLNYISYPVSKAQMEAMAYELIPVETNAGALENDIDAAKRALYFKGLIDMQKLITTRLTKEVNTNPADSIDWEKYYDEIIKL